MTAWQMSIESSRRFNRESTSRTRAASDDRRLVTPDQLGRCLLITRTSQDNQCLERL